LDVPPSIPRDVDRMDADERAKFEWPFIMTHKHDPVGRLWWESIKQHISLAIPNQGRYIEELLARDGYNDRYFNTKDSMRSA
jgi:hypothetical protein